MTRTAHQDPAASPPSDRSDSIDLLRGSSAAEPALTAYLTRALHDDARAFLARPGKAFRARLIEACFALAEGPIGELPTAALEAVELLHGGSLIVDDIQDDAELRRGEPALHRLIGTPRAINTGNWLYFVALARFDDLPLDPGQARALIRAVHACLVRCHEGQALDLALRVDELRRSELASLARTISLLKTGALTGFAAALGGRLAAASQAALAALTTFGEKVGIALQMLDDLSAFTCATRQHKALEDLRGKRVNYAWAWASETRDELTFKQLLHKLSRDGELLALRARLAEAVEPLGRERVHSTLAEAKDELARAFVPSPAREALYAELRRLEQSYG